MIKKKNFSLFEEVKEQSEVLEIGLKTEESQISNIKLNSATKIKNKGKYSFEIPRLDPAKFDKASPATH